MSYRIGYGDEDEFTDTWKIHLDKMKTDPNYKKEYDNNNKSLLDFVRKKYNKEFEKEKKWN